MEREDGKFLRKLWQIEEHARALTQELPPGEACNRARLVLGLMEAMKKQKHEVLHALRQIEEHADALAKALPSGLQLNRARQIKAMAAHLALQTELERAGGHLHEAANDAARGENRSPA